MSNKSSIIIKAGLLVGTLDILSAFFYYFLKTGKKDVFVILKYVASGLFGKEALTAGNVMNIAGLLLHYLIAFAFTLFFFMIYPRIRAFSKYTILTGIIYGIFIWMVMNLVVVPLSGIGYRPFDLANAAINMLILIVCIGIPLSLMAGNFYNRKDIKL